MSSYDTTPPPINEDEALARALQEEYEREYRRRSLQQHLGQPTPPTRVPRSSVPPPPRVSSRNHPPAVPSYPAPSAPAEEVFVETPFDPFNIEVSDAEYAFRLQQEERAARRAARSSRRSESTPRDRASRSTTSRNPSYLSSRSSLDDEEIYKKIEQERKDEELARRLSMAEERRSSIYTTGPPASNRISSSSRSNSNATSSSAHGVVVRGSALSDEELARRLEQESRDEELARSMNAREQERSSARVARAVATTSTRRCTARRCCSILVPLVLIAVAVGILIYYFTGSKGLPNFIPGPEQFRGEDPFNNANPDDANVWRNKGKGLELTVINALDESWYPYFNTAVQQWDDGTPDALSLQVEMGQAPSPICREVDGAIKVCNGDYGATNWRGINKVLLANGWIYSSAARMNEYYFQGEDSAQRQYTMCHELGHGFGLPHTDESFFNRDLGNCMDYTNRPENNMQPDTPNFEFLTTLYGSLDGSIPPGGLATGTVEASETVPSDEDGSGGRNLRGFGNKLHSLLRSDRDSWLDEIDAMIDSGNIRPERDGWRVLHQSPRAESYEIDMGDGHTVQIHMLLAWEET